MKIGYQGKNGTYSEMACIKCFKDTDYEAISYTNFISLINDVNNGVIDMALLPVENSTTGIIYRTYDLLKDYDVYAIKELYLHVQEDLIGIKGSKLADIKTVYSHPEPLIQCAQYLSKHNMNPVSYTDTASSVQLVKERNDRTLAALASPLACEYYDMETLDTNVQDIKHNTTRFFVISKDKIINNDHNKISMYFKVNHQTGALFEVIKLFHDYDINLLKIESRPVPELLFEYCFYVDFEGNINQDNIKELFVKLSNHCLEYKVLGTYHMANKESLS